MFGLTPGHAGLFCDRTVSDSGPAVFSVMRTSRMMVDGLDRQHEKEKRRDFVGSCCIVNHLWTSSNHALLEEKTKIQNTPEIKENAF